MELTTHRQLLELSNDTKLVRLVFEGRTCTNWYTKSVSDYEHLVRRAREAAREGAIWTKIEHRYKTANLYGSAPFDLKWVFDENWDEYGQYSIT